MTLTAWDHQANRDIKAILDNPDHIDQTDLIDKLREYTRDHCYNSYNEGYDDAVKLRGAKK